MKVSPWVVIALFAVIAFFAAGYFFLNGLAWSSRAGIKSGRAYYWCSKSVDGAVQNRYCYGSTGACQTYNIYGSRPKDNPKKGITYNCYPERVYLRRRGPPCPPTDCVVEGSDGHSIGCFGGYMETNNLKKSCFGK